MRIAIASDHGGFCQKAPMVEYLEGLGHTVVDLGPSTGDRCDYPDYGDKVARFVAAGKSDRGILICGTGIGMAMTANKFKGIRAAVCHDAYSAERSVLSNDCNVLCMGARVIGSELAKKIVDEWVGLQFDPNGRSGPKVREIMNIEGANLK